MPAISWLSSDHGLLVLGTSLVLGGLGFLWADCLRLWRIRRKRRDVVDLVTTSVFTATIAGVALTLHTWDSMPAAATGLAAAALSYLSLRRFLRTQQA